MPTTTTTRHEVTISRHAYNNGIARFGFDARAMANIVRQGDLLSLEEQELIWNSRPMTRKFATKETKYYFDEATSAVAVVVPTPEGPVMVTIYEARYINQHRKGDQWTRPAIDRTNRNTRKAEACISRAEADALWERYRKGAKVFVRGEQRELFVCDGGDVRFVKGEKVELLCHFREQDITTLEQDNDEGRN